MKNITKKLRKFINGIGSYVIYAFKSGEPKMFLKAFLNSYINHLRHFMHHLNHEVIPTVQSPQDPQIKKLAKTVMGLHSLLPFDPLYTYSVLIEIKDPSLKYVEEVLFSLSQQSSSSLEILIGYPFSESKALDERLKSLKEDSKTRILLFEGSVIHQLAQQAKGHFLFIMGEQDWMRPDLFYRYEQTLRIHKDPENIVLYCDVNEISTSGYFFQTAETKQSGDLHFPYFFHPFLKGGLLFSKKLWKEAQCYTACEDLLLQLDLAGAHFQYVPFSLYSRRRKKISVNSNDQLLKSLQHYSEVKKLKWKWEEGLHNTLRGIPPLKEEYWVQVIIPYKDQKELTLRCIEKLLQQDYQNIKITAVNNLSVDSSIAIKIQELGGEVIDVDEPFNYSRLNNLAVERSKTAQKCDLLLFLNNDVELNHDALSEMMRWIDQPQIGIVGCLLNYPDGDVQHGGVKLVHNGSQSMEWVHKDRDDPFQERRSTPPSQQLGVVDAVTAACALMKKDNFTRVGGFDEVWYPIGFSDTHLAMKLRQIGLKSFYTPYAVGIHHESVSRKKSIEDYENSWWLHELLLSRIKEGARL